MFETFGYLMKAWIYLWMTIIATIPNAFMGGLTMCIGATVLTYLLRSKKTTRKKS